ncbi:MAG: glycyl-radical enzyme activating protein [Bacillales bacterium]|jgi:pyruvate formate lyase activating enzyme|nr:glycyl-radical enzyme activating protein [Bacillales bacterium]
MKGRIFAIEEFAVYDGPGIRTTLFLKGCPLNCNWCHNPEGKEYKKQSLRNLNGCLDCKACFKVCPFKRESCNACGNCLSVCPKNLIRMSGIDYEAQELATILLKNVDILKMNKGGITITGGEPLAQLDFLNELLDLLKGKVHLAIETSGYCQTNDFLKIINKLDLVIMDAKIIEKEKALKYLGVDNELIINNLKELSKSKIPHIIRIPLIPEVSDTLDNLKDIIALIKDSSSLLGVELLPYNKFAGSKYKLIGKEYKPLFKENLQVNINTKIFIDNQIEVRGM